MNELITIIIIISAIISFINKMKKQQQQQKDQSTEDADVKKPKPIEWKLPWEEESGIDEFEEQEVQPVFEQEFQEVAPAPEPEKQEQVKPEPIKQIPRVDSSQIFDKGSSPPLEISLKSSDDLKRGILLLEILGPCKANKKARHR
ncbi:hypothetical protein B6I21_00125 [candidate division KSB1 bacterium 4572_119]|nr:MAG: hypothetical protein B6I21_00125 [candidate division KSB1 bacterium 4572_119]